MLADFDDDADPDLLVANGHIFDNVAEVRPDLAYRQPNQLFANDGAGRLEVDWPAGARQRLRSLPVARRIAIFEPAAPTQRPPSPTRKEPDR